MKNAITIPRIIGIILLVIAALAYRTQGLLRTAIIAIAGLVLLFASRQNAAKHWKEFLATFKLRKEFVLAMLYDIVFWALLAVLIAVLAGALQGPIAQLRVMQLGQSTTIGAIASYNAMLGSIFATSITSLIVFWLFVVAAYSFSRLLIWLTLNNKPFQARHFATFCLLNLAWCTAWLALALFCLIAITPAAAAYAFIALLVLYAHLTTILHNAYAQGTTAGASVRKAFGTLGDATLAQPYAYVFIAYLILSQVQRLVQNQGKTGLAVSFVLFLAFMAGYRIYIRNMLRHTT